jgi:hypothetical protein
MPTLMDKFKALLAGLGITPAQLKELLSDPEVGSGTPVAASPAPAPADGTVDVATSAQSTLPGENALVSAAGEVLGERFTQVQAIGQLYDLESSLFGKAEVIGYRIPSLDQVMGKDSEVIGVLVGGLGDVAKDRHAIGDELNKATPVNVQVQLLSSTGVKSPWLSFAQANPDAYELRHQAVQDQTTGVESMQAVLVRKGS